MGRETLMEPAGDGEARRGALQQQPTRGRSLRDAVALRRATESQRRRLACNDRGWTVLNLIPCTFHVIGLSCISMFVFPTCN